MGNYPHLKLQIPPIHSRTRGYHAPPRLTNLQNETTQVDTFEARAASQLAWWFSGGSLRKNPHLIGDLL